MGHGTSKSGVPEPPDANNGSSSSRSSRFRRRFRWNRRGNGSDSNPQLKNISAEDFSGIARIQLNHVRSNPPSPDLSKNPVLWTQISSSRRPKWSSRTVGSLAFRWENGRFGRRHRISYVTHCFTDSKLWTVFSTPCGRGETETSFTVFEIEFVLVLFFFLFFLFLEKSGRNGFL